MIVCFALRSCFHTTHTAPEVLRLSHAMEVHQARVEQVRSDAYHRPRNNSRDKDTKNDLTRYPRQPHNPRAGTAPTVRGYPGAHRPDADLELRPSH